MTYKKSIFKGVGTALITPFKNGKIDYPCLKRLIELQISGGANAIILLGTTGEASTVSEGEREEIISFAKKEINGAAKLIVGTGTNNTEVSIRYSKSATELGADALLLVTPYYNKASALGLTRHYEAVASNTNLPIILYNVPSRTGVNIDISVYKALSSVPNIVAIKEASGNISYLCEILDTCGDFFDVYSGNDELTLAFLALGGAGVISVCAGVVPSKVAELCSSFFKGDLARARKTQLELIRLNKAMFCEVNPIPIKYACSLLGLCENELRLPLCPCTRQAEVEKALASYGLI